MRRCDISQLRSLGSPNLTAKSDAGTLRRDNTGIQYLARRMRCERTYLAMRTLLDWIAINLSGVGLAAIVSLPALSLPSVGLQRRLITAIASVFAVDVIFWMIITVSHQFHFWHLEDLLVQGVGIAVAFLLSLPLRLLWSLKWQLRWIRRTACWAAKSSWPWQM